MTRAEYVSDLTFYGAAIKMAKRASALAIAAAPHTQDGKGMSGKASAILLYTDDPRVAEVFLRETDLNHIARVSQIEGVCLAPSGVFPPSSHEAERPNSQSPRIAAMWFPASGDECHRCQLFYLDLADGLCSRCSETQS